jgi:DtxR family Mn-dependent transcriptional regulator
MINDYRQDYVRAVFVLSQRQGEVRGKDLAAYMHVSKNTVSVMMGRLKAAGLVKYESYGPIALSASGMRLARKLTEKHRLIELFLARVLKRDPKKVHDEAGMLEHDFSDESIAAMRKLLRNPKADPHGQPIKV